jgi:hypothetical protein
VPREHTGLGTLQVPGRTDVKVVLDIAPDTTGGWQTVRGTITGDPVALAAALENNQEADLIHDATGFMMHLTITDVTPNGTEHVTVVATRPR